MFILDLALHFRPFDTMRSAINAVSLLTEDIDRTRLQLNDTNLTPEQRTEATLRVQAGEFRKKNNEGRTENVFNFFAFLDRLFQRIQATFHPRG